MLPYGLELGEGTDRMIVRAAPGERRSAPARARAVALGRVPAGPDRSSRARPLRPRRPRRPGREPDHAARVPAARAAALARRPARDAAVRRQPRRARPRRGHRVRRPAAVRRRRPRAPHELARERPPRRAVRQRAAPGAEQRRRALPRQLRRGAARAREHARPGRARGGVARARVPRAARPRRRRRLRRRRPLAAALDRPRPGLPHRRRADHVRGDALVRAEGRGRAAAADRCRRRRS